jgi:hypothetical protein
MKPVREIVSREIIDDLWGAGYSILPRARHPDPFHVPAEMVPQGRSYQWFDLKHDKFHYGDDEHNTGWAPVPAARHDGYFMPAGFIGDIEVSGLGLFEKPKFEVERDRAAAIQKAQDAGDPAKFFAGKGFSGSVTIGTQTKLGELDTVKATEIGSTKTIENITKIPRELTPCIAQIFEERDRLAHALQNAWDDNLALTDDQAAITKRYRLAVEEDSGVARWPTLNAMILPYAIAIVRKRIAEEAENAKTS